MSAGLGAALGVAIAGPAWWMLASPRHLPEATLNDEAAAAEAPDPASAFEPAPGRRRIAELCIRFARSDLKAHDAQVVLSSGDPAWDREVRDQALQFTALEHTELGRWLPIWISSTGSRTERLVHFQLPSQPSFRCDPVRGPLWTK